MSTLRSRASPAARARWPAISTSGASEQDAGLASGLLTAVSYLGGALGLATLSAVAASRTASLLADRPDAGTVALVGGYRAAYLVSAVLLATAAGPIMLLLRRHHLAAVEGLDTRGS